MSRQLLGQTILAVKEVLASGGTWPRRSTSGAGPPDRFKQVPAGLWIGHRPDRNKAHGGLAVTRQDDLIARLSPSDQVRQLALCVGYGNMHWITCFGLLNGSFL
jgi:hypothetical protein